MLITLTPALKSKIPSTDSMKEQWHYVGHHVEVEDHGEQHKKNNSADITINRVKQVKVTSFKYFGVSSSINFLNYIQNMLHDKLKVGRCRCHKQRCCIDNLKQWTLLAMDELLSAAHNRHYLQSISVLSSHITCLDLHQSRE
ncbi:hypothetical protein DPMN_075386 [Dreissena polymorpha]|uniref:Uncharacterized protein n=1 Tax=Dreissena polymorpha TaxID=45954 RepID=A0A9D4BEV3_DREPO|nr:hypothetical protein DPMN_075386 [Dreissena polymorpha]